MDSDNWMDSEWMDKFMSTSMEASVSDDAEMQFIDKCVEETMDVSVSDDAEVQFIEKLLKATMGESYIAPTSASNTEQRQQYMAQECMNNPAHNSNVYQYQQENQNWQYQQENQNWQYQQPNSDQQLCGPAIEPCAAPVDPNYITRALTSDGKFLLIVDHNADGKENAPVNIVIEHAPNQLPTPSPSPNSGGTVTPQRLKCEICDKTFTAQCYLTQHKKAKHSGVDLPCQSCSKVLHSTTAFEKHMAFHRGEYIRKQCLECPKSFRHQSDLNRHIASHHNKGSLHFCLTCGKGFARQDHLRKHTNTHLRRQRNKEPSKQVSWQ